MFFIAPPLKIRFSVPVERVETTFLNLGLKVAVSTRSTVTANQILKRVAMKNSVHYIKIFKILYLFDYIMSISINES